MSSFVEAEMDVRGGLRAYERDVIERVGHTGAHVLLPQGAQTTAVGLALIRRLEGPAAVFSADVTAQLRWQQTLSRSAGPADVVALSSLDPRRAAPIMLLTWDDFGSANTNTELVWQLAIDRWATKLVAAGRAPDITAAHARIDRWAQHNPRKVGHTLDLERAELAARVAEVEPADLSARLPEAARRFVDGLVEHDVRLIVLDGCDQLSDWRALLLRLLVSALGDGSRPPAVVGLSTVPRSVPGAHRYCRDLMSGKDMEPPTPPVVQSGDVAPHRDLVSFVSVTRSERERLALLERATRRTRRAAAEILDGTEEKPRAAAEILACEHAARPDQLHAVVLAGDETRAAAAFTRLAADRAVQPLAPALLTKDGLITSDEHASRLMASCETTVERLGLRARLSRQTSPLEGATLVAGAGEDWSPRTVTVLAARALNGGATSCIVGGASGPLHEGWDELEVDTVIDLSSLYTPTAARLRSSALCASGSDTHKVTHVWHVVAHDPRALLGDLDVRRFAARMADRWGLPLGERGSRIVRGPAAIDHTLATAKPGTVDYRAVNARCLTQIGDRTATHARWMTGGTSDASIVTSVDAADVDEPFRLLELLEQLHVPILLSALLLVLVILVYGIDIQGAFRFASQLAALATAALVGATGRGALRTVLASRASPEQRLVTRCRAVLDALRESGHVDLHLGAEAIQVIQTEPRRFEVRLDDVSARDARVFAATLTETLAPLNSQPYVISSGTQTIPVPAAFTEDPDTFLQHWRTHSGQGHLVAIHERPLPSPQPSPRKTKTMEVWEPQS